MKNGRIVNLNPDAKGGRKVRPATAKQAKKANELEARAKKAKKGDLKRVLDKVPDRPPIPGDETE